MKKNVNSGGPARNNKEHAGDVLALVGETGAGNDAGEQGDNEEEAEFKSESRDINVEMGGADGPADGPANDNRPEGEGAADEENIVASMYEEEGVGDDTLYRKLLFMIQDLAKDHKLLHEKIAELTVRLDQKEANTCKTGNSRKATNVDVEMEPPPTTKHQSAQKKKPVHWQQDDIYEHPAGRRVRNPTCLLLLAPKGYIRQAILALLGRQTCKELLPDGPADNIAAPSEAMFYVKWTESEKSQFNKVAANIVVTKVAKDWPALCSEDNHNSLHAMATQHI
ncbi:hypothetical protein FRC10_010356 [Ceratobasidium sp. 414]|nr:hypothetical protein FRC10_010356 [Ceratobasidium sp. 414]